ncbi:MAG TPA: ferritin-like domain-containing protein [Nannocystaceae bacterium]|nr:ferritin-like domain-containing protein [Nannocystaceae bacterium]
MSDYHEPLETLSNAVRDIHRALISLKEEIEAIDWYNQRVAACTDDALRKVLAHNRDEEIEHAVMTLEWVRRNMPGWDEQLRKRLFTKDPIVAEGD